MIVCFECKRAASKVVSIVLFLIYLLCTDLFTCTQQMHCGIYVPVSTNFLMIVCSGCKQLQKLWVLYLIYLLWVDLFTCTQQMHWGIYVPV